MDGANLRDGLMEVAFEQWTERVCLCQGVQDISRLQRIPYVTGELYRSRRSAHRCRAAGFCTDRVQRGSLNLGGNTDEKIRPKLR